jgi:DNA-binding NtrC family response regulator
MPYTEAKRRAVDEFERVYLKELLHQHGDKMTKAAAAAGINRIYLYKLLRKHRLK